MINQSLLANTNPYANEEPSINYVSSNGRVQVLYPGQGHLARDTIEVLENDYSCPVCIHTHERPLRTRDCHHHLCAPCFNQLTPTPRDNAFFSGNLTKKCPMCRHELGTSETSADEVLEDIPGARAAVDLIYRNCRVISESVEPITFSSAANSVWSALQTILSVPFRTCNTALNLGLFAGYYVTVMTCTALGTMTGATIGFANAVKSEITGQQSTRSIRDYTVSYAKETFKFLSTPYQALPRDSHSYVLPSLVCLTLFFLEIWASSRSSTHYSSGTTRAYEGLFELAYKISVPYKPVTSRTVSLFRETDNYIRSF